jgi:arylsulfatase A-like enzyme
MPETTQHPDIVLLILDTHRVDRLSCYGYERRTTPYIDRFAANATLFEHAVSPAQWTIPAHASLFTGEYPATHMTTQIYNTLSDSFTTLAEFLRRGGYHTIGFCNNPLLGVVENHLDRGFDSFHNYGGAMPNPPSISESRPGSMGRLYERWNRFIRPVVTRIANLFAHNNFLLKIAFNPVLSFIWLRAANFKGDTLRSLRDTVGYLRAYHKSEDRKPIFTFINLMGTHLPYWPPKRFLRRFAPYYRKDRELQDFMRFYNTQTYRWMLPLNEPFTGKKNQILQDLYDAESAYQDHLLRHLFKYLNQPEIRDNTLVIITADHGEGLNHHNFIGHSLVAYDDLVHVPLIIRYPRLYPKGVRISDLVSTRRIFHTILEAAGVPIDNQGNGGNGKTGDVRRQAPIDVQRLSLARTVEGKNAEGEYVFTEAYTPHTLLTQMEQHSDEDTIERFRCREMRRAAYRGDHKLITVGEKPDELFNLSTDPAELANLIESEPDTADDLYAALQSFIAETERRRPENWEDSEKLNLDDDEDLTERLRALGYLD